MSGGFLRLRWHVASDGYALTSLGPSRRLKVETRTWTVQPFEADGSSTTFLVPRSLKLRAYEVSILNPGIFNELASAPATPAGALSFVNKWGPLFDGAWNKPARPQSLDWFYEARAVMKDAIEIGNRGGDTAVVRHLEHYEYSLSHAKRGGAGFLFGTVDTRFDWEHRGDRARDKPRLFFQARTLRQFCHLEHLHALAGGIDIAKCEACGAYLRIPKTGRPPRHCDDACRQVACRKRKREEAATVGRMRVRVPKPKRVTKLKRVSG